VISRVLRLAGKNDCEAERQALRKEAEALAIRLCQTSQETARVEIVLVPEGKRPLRRLLSTYWCHP
jgi:hypothetical protein